MRTAKDSTVGARLRKARQSHHLSLQQVAEKAHLSSATLSRIETSRQSLDVYVLLELARILELSPAELLEEEGQTANPQLSAIISRMGARERMRFWKELCERVRSRKVNVSQSSSKYRAIAAEVEDLAAQLDFVSEQLEYLRKCLRKP